MGDAQGGVAHLASLLTEDGAQEALLGGQLGLALRGDLTDEDVTGGDLGADADDAALVQVSEGFLGDVGDVAGDLFLTELGLAGVDLVFLDVDRGEDVLFHDATAQDDGVLVVEAFPRHVGDEEVLAERDLTVGGGGAVGQDVADLDAVALVHDNALVGAVTGVGALELLEAVGVAAALVRGDDDQVRGDLGDDAGVRGEDHFAGVVRGAQLHAGADQRGFRGEQRHGLTLHVRAHEGSVSVVVLQEGNERRGDGHHLARGDVHVVDAIAGDQGRVFAGDTAQDVVFGEGAVGLEGRRGLGDEVALLVVRGEVADFVGDLAVLDDAVGRLDEAEGVDAREGRERADEADVRAFRGLDRAHAAVVRGVDVSNFHAGAVTGQAAGAQGRQAALVGQAGQRVVLVHELRELGGSEELLDRGHDGADVDQRLGRDRVRLLGGHALAHGAFHAGEAGADLTLDELADGADATVGEVVDVVDLDADLDGLTTAGAGEGLVALVEGEEVLDGGDDVLEGEGRGLGVGFDGQLLVDLVAADLGQVVATRVEVEVVEQRLGGVDVRGLAGAQLAVDVEQGLFLRADGVLLEGFKQDRVRGEGVANLGLGHADGLEEVGDRLLTLAVDAHADGVALVDLELEPRAARGDDLRAEGFLVGRAVRELLEVHAGGTHELGDDDALGAVDNEGTAWGHEREVAHEHGLGLDFAGFVVHELGGHVHGCGVRVVLRLGFLHGVLGGFEAVVVERQAHGACDVLDGGNLVEDFFEAGDVGDVISAGCLSGFDAGLPRVVTQQPVEAFDLQAQQIGGLEGFTKLGERDAVLGLFGGAVGSQRGSFPA